jgi:RNA polymerase sigma factor (sigma-70 family)
MTSMVLVADGPFAPKWNGRPAAAFDAAICARAASCEDEGESWETVAAPPEIVSLTSPRPPELGDSIDFAMLVERIAAHGDKAAFASVFAYFAPRVKAYLLRLGLDAAQGEEIAQDVMVAVWRKAATFDRRQASVATWIFRIARNRRIDAFRRERRAQLDAHDPLFQPAPEAAPDSVAETSEREAHVRRAMAELPHDQRELVREAFYADLSHREIAEKTGVPLGTVKSRLRLAFAKLKLRLEADDAATVEVGR